MPAPALPADAVFTKTAMLVIDFEATTPAGHRPQPIEVATLAIRHVPSQGPQPTGFTYRSLIRPPAFAPVQQEYGAGPPQFAPFAYACQVPHAAAQLTCA